MVVKEEFTQVSVLKSCWFGLTDFWSHACMRFSFFADILLSYSYYIYFIIFPIYMLIICPAYSIIMCIRKCMHAWNSLHCMYTCACIHLVRITSAVHRVRLCTCICYTFYCRFCDTTQVHLWLHTCRNALIPCLQLLLQSPPALSV